MEKPGEQSCEYNNPMPKTITHFVCQQCGKTSPRSLGKCPQCGGWDTFVEEVIQTHSEPAKTHLRGMNARSEPRRMSEIAGDAEERIPLPISEFARVLGGGVVPGSIVLVGGDPGIGKSTLLLQMALEMAGTQGKAGQKVLYVSGEESERQIKMRALRLTRLAAENNEHTFSADLLLGLLLYRREERHPVAFLVWISSAITPLLLIIAVFILAVN